MFEEERNVQFTGSKGVHTDAPDFLLEQIVNAMGPLNFADAQRMRQQLQPAENAIKQAIDETMEDMREQAQRDTTTQQLTPQQALKTFGTSSQPLQRTRTTRQTTDQTQQSTQRSTPLDTPTDPQPQTIEATNTNKSENPVFDESLDDSPLYPDTSLTPEMVEEPDQKTDPRTSESNDTNETQRNNPNSRQAQQLARVQQQRMLQQQQSRRLEMMSKQQLKNKLTQLQQQKRELEKKLLDEIDTQEAFGMKQAALFVPAITTIAYLIDLADFTEFIAPFFDMLVAIISTYWNMTRSIKEKIFYLKQLPGFLFARLLGMIPIISYFGPEMLQMFQSTLQRIKKFRKARTAVKPLKEQIEHIDKQIQNVQKQLSSRSFFSKPQKQS